MAKQGNNFKNAKRSGLQPRMPKKPAGGFQSWMVVGLVIAVISMFFFSKETSLQPITIKQFESMLIQKEVEKVVIVNDKIVEEVRQYIKSTGPTQESSSAPES